MGTPEIDRRRKEDIIRAIAQRAAAYTPEWRFDRENPDVGSALALIYAELFSQTLKRYNQVPAKNMVAFFNSLDERLLPALPADGFVSFGLAGEVEDGAEVCAGTPLLADCAETESGTVVFETTDDVLVIPARPERIFTVCGGADTIVRSWDAEEQTEGGVSLFDLKGENLQSHRMLLSQDAVLDLSAGGTLKVEFVPAHQRELPREVREALADPGRCVWEYSCGASWQPFSSCVSEGNCILLALGRHQLPVEPSEEEGLEGRRWLRLRLLEQAELPPFQLRLIRLSSENRDLQPDLVHASGVDQNIHSFFPFGEQLGLFGEAYFGCNEALVKQGAEIEMTFQLEFVPVPMDYTPGQSPVNWKLVMKKSDFKPDEEYDIAIQEVLWEYFNGEGWARLFPDSRESDCFNASLNTASRMKTIRFRCPEDMSAVLVNAETGYFIRARILKIRNLFKLKGNYIAPYVEGLRFAYHYPERGRIPQLVITENHCEQQLLEGSMFRGGDLMLSPFTRLEETSAALYFAFSAAPSGGPVKILFEMGEPLREKPGRLRWEYLTDRGWESLNIVDETENLRHSGILTMMSGNRYRRQRLWNTERYWIRAVDEEGRYWGRESAVQLPRLMGLYINTTRVKNVDTQPPERFFIEPEQKNFVCELLGDSIQHAQVWVEESAALLPGEIESLTRSGRLRQVRDAAGVLREAWVRWEEREDFALSESEDRHYTLDRNSGCIRFSDGINGKIPPSGRSETIEVFYATGGGVQGNVPAGGINRSSRALGFVSRVENPRPTVGGCDQETLRQATARSAAALRHGDRAVTARDFEALAMEATRNIVRAKCFANRDETGRARPGWVTLAVLLRDPDPDGSLMTMVGNQVKDYITDRCSGNLAALGHFQVVRPQFMQIRVKAELVVSDFNHVFPVREETNRRLREFLDPMTGNFDGGGWEMGQLPNDTQLRNCLSGMPGLKYLKQVTSAVYAETAFGLTEVNPENLRDWVFALPQSARHEVIIAIE